MDDRLLRCEGVGTEQAEEDGCDRVTGLPDLSSLTLHKWKQLR